jgi:hypothetical protein
MRGERAQLITPRRTLSLVSKSKPQKSTDIGYASTSIGKCGNGECRSAEPDN